MHDIEKWNFITDLVGNIILFIPLPFFLSLLFNIKSAARLVLTCSLVSLVVEVSQYVLGIGVADVDDIIFNTLGACMGAVLVKIWLAMKLKWLSKSKVKS